MLLLGCFLEIIIVLILINFGFFLFRKYILIFIFIYFYILEISENSSFKYVIKLVLGVISFLRGELVN